jgi:hypothetical protein
MTAASRRYCAEVVSPAESFFTVLPIANQKNARRKLSRRAISSPPEP